MLALLTQISLNQWKNGAYTASAKNANAMGAIAGLLHGALGTKGAAELINRHTQSISTWITEEEQRRATQWPISGAEVVAAAERILKGGATDVERAL